MRVLSAFAFAIIGYLALITLLSNQTFFELLVDIHTYLSTPIP